MEKRLLLTIALSLAVLLFWSTFITKPYHIDNKQVTDNPPLLSTPAQPASVFQRPLDRKEPSEETLLTFSQKNIDLIFIESGAAIKKVVFKNHQSYSFSLGHGFSLAEQDLRFVKTAMDSHSVTFTAEDNGKKIIKKFLFSEDKYDAWMTIRVLNTSADAIKINLPIEFGELDFSDSAQAQFKGALVKTDEKTLHINAKKNENFSNVLFVGIKDQYFCAILDPDQDNYAASVSKVNGQLSKLFVKPAEINLAPGQSVEYKYRIYLGPQEINEINKIKPEWAAVINYGTFDFISQLLLQLLYFVNKLVNNWGLAIIILSILVYLCLYPLTLKQMRSVKEMQLLQPHIEELKCKLKDNPQKLNKEIMELYRQHKVNPFGGCLPLVLQMPIFFALYQALMRSIVLKGASFMWIKDLSQPDRLFLFPAPIPFVGNEFNLLPIIMAIGMFFQQKVSMSSTTVGSSAEQQKIMLILFPIMFGFIFYHMPAGLVLYWLTNSILTVSFQFKTKQIK